MSQLISLSTGKVFDTESQVLKENKNSMKTAVKRKRKAAISTGLERICSHYIEWRLEGKGLQLLDIDVEHIQNSLIDNSMQGELCSIAPNGNTVFGWWNIQM